MNVRYNKSKVEGYEDSKGQIVIDYHFSNGTQSKEHPHPGKKFTGTSRTCYLPDNEKGREVLKLLQIAFDRKLTFTVSRSITTGQDDQVVWSGIHHKTSAGGGAYGYPDEGYLDRVTEELRDKGVIAEK